jgi:hypothetical protein
MINPQTDNLRKILKRCDEILSTDHPCARSEITELYLLASDFDHLKECRNLMLKSFREFESLKTPTDKAEALAAVRDNVLTLKTLAGMGLPN